MPRKAGLSSQLHGVARSSNNFPAAREGPGLYAERLARRRRAAKPWRHGQAAAHLWAEVGVQV
jgi:hypothetical protein